jgi:hypothetical protein
MNLINLDKSAMTYKSRIVFDEAALDCHEKSLNSEIDKGPNQINNDYQVLLRFRQFEYAV